MEKQPNLKIGDQEFEKVGEMESNPTGLKYTPKSFDLYKDTESGALMGKLPDYPDYRLSYEIKKKEIEKNIETLDIDLTLLSLPEVYELIMHNKSQLYGRSLMSLGEKPFENEKMEIRDGYLCGHLKDEDDLSSVKMTPESIRSVSRNRIVISTDHVNPSDQLDGTRSIEFSFMEIPEGYKELIEKKEGKAE